MKAQEFAPMSASEIVAALAYNVASANRFEISVATMRDRNAGLWAEADRRRIANDVIAEWSEQQDVRVRALGWQT